MLKWVLDLAIKVGAKFLGLWADLIAKGYSKVHSDLYDFDATYALVFVYFIYRG